MRSRGRTFCDGSALIPCPDRFDSFLPFETTGSVKVFTARLRQLPEEFFASKCSRRRHACLLPSSLSTLACVTFGFVIRSKSMVNRCLNYGLTTVKPDRNFWNGSDDIGQVGRPVREVVLFLVNCSLRIRPDEMASGRLTVANAPVLQNEPIWESDKSQ